MYEERVVIPEIISSTGPDMSAMSIPVWLDLSAVVIGSVSGILVAQERKLDPVGYVALAVICGLGGGLVRDVIMQRGGVYMLDSAAAIPLTVTAGLFGFLFPSILKKFPNLLEWVDIISVGLFVAAGTDKAIVYSLTPWAAVLMGTITGVGGGMVRDICLGDTPRIFQRSNFYAVCALAGAVAYYAGVLLICFNRTWAVVLCVAITVGLRRYSLRFNVLSPIDVDLVPKVKESAREMYQQAIDEGMHRSKKITRRLTRKKAHDHRFVLVHDHEDKKDSNK